MLVFLTIRSLAPGATQTMSTQNPYETPSTNAPSVLHVDTGALTVVDWIVCILCSGLGCLVGIFRLVQGKKSGPKMIGFSLLFGVLWNVLFFVIQALAGQAP